MEKYIIKSNDGYWNNEEGWMETSIEATEFSKAETVIFDLPIGDNVRWEEA